MAILNSSELTPKEKERDDAIAEALVDGVPKVPGVVCLRGMSPLVMTALHKSNNPYVTGKLGFEAMGTQFEDNGDVKNFAAFGVAMMPKTAAVLVLWTCDRPALKRFATDPELLESASLDYMEDFPGGVAGLAEVTMHVSEALKAVQLAKAVAVDNDSQPQASTLEGGQDGPKQHARTGSHQ